MANELFVMKSDVALDSVRKCIPETWHEVMAYMDVVGWDIHLSFPDVNEKGFGYLMFSKRDPWHDRPMLTTRGQFGYHFQDIDDLTLNSTARLAAELCLRVYETFGRILPSEPNVHGKIRPCPIANKPEFSGETYEAYQARHADKAFRIIPDPGYPLCCWCFSYGGDRIAIHYADNEKLSPWLNYADEVLRGAMVFIE